VHSTARRWLSAWLLVATLSACAKEDPKADTAPETPAESENRKKVESLTLTPKAPPTTKLRLLFRTPDGPPAGTATLNLGNAPALSDLPVKSLTAASMGRTLLLLVTAGVSLPMQIEGLKTILKAVARYDRVSVGFIGAQGFKLIVDFSVDTRGAITALNHLRDQFKSKNHVSQIALISALHQALAVFAQRRGLPKLKALVMLSDGVDATLRRKSLKERRRIGLIRHAQQLGVTINAVGLGLQDEALKQLQNLVLATGGSYEKVNWGTGSLDESVAKAFGDLSLSLNRWAVVDVSAPGLPSGHNALTLRWQNGTANRVIERPCTIPVAGSGRATLILEIPPRPALPPTIAGHTRNLKTAARAAEKRGQLLRAGVLWHLAAEQEPNDYGVLSKARELTSRYIGDSQQRGELLVGGRGVGVDVAIRHRPEWVANTWIKLTGSAGGLHKVVFSKPARETPKDDESSKDDPPQEPEMPPLPQIKQVVLHACWTFTTQDCLSRLLVKERATHFIVDGSGEVTQLVDLATLVTSPHSPPGSAIHVHLTIPPPQSLTPQDPGNRATFRQWRRYKENVEVNGKIQSGWGLTPAQEDALLPLLKGLSKALPDIRPVFPIDMNRRETLDTLLHKDEFQGVLSHSNLNRRVVDCPGPGIGLAHLNRHLGRWSLKARDLDVESWINDFWLDGRSVGAVQRFREVADLVLPMLAELARELPPAQARFALQSMAQKQSARGAAALVKMLNHNLPAGSEAAEVSNFFGDVLTALVRIGTAKEFDAIWAFMDRIPQLGLDPAAQTLLTYSAMVALMACAGKESRMTPFEEQLSSGEPMVRAQAAMGLLVHGGNAGKEALKAHLNDSEAWIRLLAARAVGADAVTVVLDIHKQIGVIPAVRALSLMSPKTPIDEMIHWYRTAERVEQHELTGLFIQWKWMTGALIVIDALAKVRGTARERLLTTLQALTGRDLGSSQKAWLKWIAKHAKNRR
jgi:hypothetical protein